MTQEIITPDQSIVSVPDFAKSIAIQVRGSSKFRKFQQTYGKDRIAFVYDIMPKYGKTLTLYQEEILGFFDGGGTRLAVRSPHGTGKTFIASIMVHHSVLTSEVDCKVPTTASAWRQLEKYLWPEIKKAGKNLAWPLIGRPPYDLTRELLQLSIRLQGGTVEAFAVASNDHTTIEGAHATRIVYVFDEAKTIPTDTWDAAEGAFSTEGLERTDAGVVELVEPMGAEKDLKSTPVEIVHGEGEEYEAMAFAISTPGQPSGRFHDIHMRAPGYEDWTVRHVTLDEAIRAGRISIKWAEQRKKQWGETSSVYLNRVLGEFAENSEDGIIPLSWVNAAIERWKEWDASGRPDMGAPYCVGVDVARFGEDQTVFAPRMGPTLQNVHEFAKLPTTGTAGHLHVFSMGGRYNLHIETDGGLGAAVFDILKEQDVPGLRPVLMHGATWKRDRSGELGFFDVRSAAWWNLREMLDPINGDGIMLPDHEQLKRDLITPRWEITSTGNIRMESKRDIVTRLGRSPDYGTAAALAFWNPSTGGGVVF